MATKPRWGGGLKALVAGPLRTFFCGFPKLGRLRPGGLKKGLLLTDMHTMEGGTC